jgi:hypothetical protein
MFELIQKFSFWLLAALEVETNFCFQRELVERDDAKPIGFTYLSHSPLVLDQLHRLGDVQTWEQSKYCAS